MVIVISFSGRQEICLPVEGQLDSRIGKEHNSMQGATAVLAVLKGS